MNMRIDKIEEKSRCGVLFLNGKEISFPNIIFCSEYGHIPSITGDLLKTMDVKWLHIHIYDFFSNFNVYKNFSESFEDKEDENDRERNRNDFGNEGETKKDELVNNDDNKKKMMNGGIHKYLNMNDYLFLFTVRDPTRFYQSHKNNLNILTKGGRRQVKPELYNDLVNYVNPDICSPMTYDIPWTSKEKRARSQVDITLKWLDCALSSSISNKVLGIITGGSSKRQRIRSAVETSKRNVQGFLIGGFGLDENPNQKYDILESVINELDSQKPRFIYDVGDPVSVLKEISMGIDFIILSYPITMTELSYALVFNIDPQNPNTENYIDLQSQIFQNDIQPILEGCQCYTCQNHKRAYLHHLKNTHEITFLVLLQIHNHYHYIKFFDKIRENIYDGTLESYKKRFLEYYT